MPHYLVKTHLACWQQWLIEAENEEDAKARYTEGEFIIDELQTDMFSIEVEETLPEQPDFVRSVD